MKPETEELLDLMIVEALHGLDDRERERLVQLLLDVDPEQVAELEQQLGTAVAVAGNASALDRETRDPGAPVLGAVTGAPPPESLLNALEADADRFFGTAGAAGEGRASGPEPSNVTSLSGRRSPGPDLADGTGESPAPARRPGRSTPGVFGWTGWAVAALLLVTVWVGRPGPATEFVAPPTAAEARIALLDLEDTVQEPWGDSAWKEFSRVQGDVVWNDARQEGYLRLSNMPANDPSEAQYQLWIVDPSRDAEPVDGGVFDVPPGVRELVVPIRAKLAVRSPAAFAITREQPGGVVVSEGPLLVVASRG